MPTSPPPPAPPILPSFRANGHGVRLGIELARVGQDWAEMTLPWHDELAGPDGALATGPLLALMDMAGSVAVWARRGGFVPHATLDLRLDRLRPVPAGRLVVGRAECRRITPTLGWVRGEAHDGDPADPVASIAGTYMTIDGGAS